MMPASKTKSLYVYPPMIQQCQAHNYSTRIFKKINEDYSKQKKCQCCHRRIGNHQNSCQLCYNEKELLFLGSGYPLFFTFLRHVVILLVLLVVIFGMFSIITNIISENCSLKNRCGDKIFSRISIASKFDNQVLVVIQNLIMLIFVCFTLVLFQIYRYLYRKLINQYEVLINSPSPYAIILRRIPSNIKQNDIEQMIYEKRLLLSDEQKRQTNDLKIVKILISYKMQEWIATKLQNLEQFKNCARQNQIQNFKEKPVPQLQQSGNFAIVIFQTAEAVQLMINGSNIFQNFIHYVCQPCAPLSEFILKGQKISIMKSPQPKQLLWQNSSTSVTSSIIYRSFSFLVLTIFLFLFGCIQYGLARASAKHQNNNAAIFFLGTASSILVTISNKILEQLAILTTKLERSIDNELIIIAMTKKISFYQFMNAGVVFIIAKILGDLQNFNIGNSLASDVTQIMIMNAITPCISKLLASYLHISGRVKRMLIRNNWVVKTQIEANQDWQQPLIHMHLHYAYIIRTIWLAALYASLSPVVIFIAIIGLLLFYWFQKFLFGNVYRVPSFLAHNLNDCAMNLLQFFSLILSVSGLLIFLTFLQFKWDRTIANWAVTLLFSIIISILQIILPTDKINYLIFKIQTSKLPIYGNIVSQFQDTYENSCPFDKSIDDYNPDKNYEKLLKLNSEGLHHQLHTQQVINPNEIVKQSKGFLGN